jgi:biopolymer transport protein ExbB/TolQ
VADRERRTVQHAGIVRSFLAALLGPLLAAGFLFAVRISPIEQLHRYFLGHPICIAITGLFFVALVALGRVWLAARQDFWIIDSLPPNALQPARLEEHLSIAAKASAWLEHLNRLPAAAQASMLVSRMHELLSRQERRGHARNLSEDLRELSERDSDSTFDSLGLVRTAVWAVPMFGFLGTVVGITQTLGDLDFSDADNAMVKLKAGLYVAFDTTALGLVLSVLAMFIQLPVEKFQQRLLARLDLIIGSLLVPALPDGQGANGSDPMSALGEMTESLLEAIARSVQTQSDVWKASILAAQQQWQSTVGTAGDQVQAALSNAIEGALGKHAAEVDRIQREGTDAIDRRWRQWQSVLSDNARIMNAHQKTLIQQGELLAAATERSDELAILRKSLDQNLTAVSQTLEAFGASNEMATAMRTLGRAIELLADRTAPLAVESSKGRKAA